MPYRLIQMMKLYFVLQQFNKLKEKFTAIELENRGDCAEIQAALGELTGATSVSSIAHRCEYFGRRYYKY